MIKKKIVKKSATKKVAKPSLNQKLKNKIEQIRKVLKLDGGDLKVVDYKNNTLSIKLLGVCSHCPMAEITIAGFIQEELKKVNPKIKIKRVN